jgi:hypothetical protein
MLVEVAIGEVVDKITILQIKKERISDPKRLDHIERELDILTEALKVEGIHVDKKFFEDLKTVNEAIWDTEEKLRREDLTIQEFVFAAKDNAKYNDERFLVKNEVNKKYDSLVQEQKAHSRLYPTD